MKDEHLSGGEFAATWNNSAAYLEANHAYDPAHEHDACGVGLVAAIDGKPRRQVVEAGIEALKALWHRGAVDADGKTGDGAGIHVQIPRISSKSISAIPATSRAKASPGCRYDFPAAHRL